MAEHNEYGEWGELVAIDHLRADGYIILDRNWRNLEGYELDIVARKDRLIVFVEVKTRRNEDLMRASDAITLTKVKHIVRAASSYMMFHRLKLDIRFDVITVVGQEPEPEVTHLEDAFSVPPSWQY